MQYALRPGEAWGPAYAAAHQLVAEQRGKAAAHTCLCGKPAEQWAYRHENAATADEQPYPFSFDTDSYDALCTNCHRHRDISRRREVQDTAVALARGTSMERNDTSSPVSRNIRVELALQGRPGTEVARAIGLAYSAWSRRMGGKIPWRVHEVEAIARVLDVPVAKLYGEQQ